MLAIKCSKIETITSDTIKNGIILIDKGKIIDVGQNLHMPEDAEVMNFQDCTACPGFIDAHAHIGLKGEGAAEAAGDTNEMTNPVTPHLRAIDGVDTYDPSFETAIDSGVTTVMMMPGSANPIGGQCSILKTWGDTMEDMLLVEKAGMKMALGENPKRVYGAQKKSPFSRMGVAAIIRENLYKALNYIKKQEKAAKEEKEFTELDFVLESLVDVVQKKARAHIHCHQAYDIMTALRIRDEFDLDISLEHCTEGYKEKVKEAIAKRNVPVVLSPLMHARTKVETSQRRLEIAAELTNAGILTAVSTDGISQQIRWLAVNAGLCVRFGMREKDALKAITINPAKIIGVDNRLGSIEPGKDADIVITKGHPLQAMTKVKTVIGNGEVIYES